MSNRKGRKIHFGHFNLVLYTDSKYFYFFPPQLVSEGHQERWDTVLDQNKLGAVFWECA